MAKDGFKVTMQADSVVDMEFYGVIGGAPFFADDDFVNAPAVLKSLKEMGKVETLRMFFNSPGGDAYGGFQIANRLDKLREDGQIETIEAHAEGMVASAATLPFLKADKRVMRNGSRFMIHRPHSFGFGNEDDFMEMAKRLQQTTAEALDLYEAVSALTRDEINNAMIAETFYTPKEAEAAGFATETVELFAVAACISPKLRGTFKHLPSDMKVVEPGYIDPSIAERAKELHPSNWQN